jgi:hypothetical protein
MVISEVFPKKKERKIHNYRMLKDTYTFRDGF